ncbi:hypothetical protein [Peribacillus sp. NPDC096540]|uniref:hypothetical protein n=1 Tax=Peribacillus sp. NPDC096540 TaxID=3390612 RepID=UPI003CFFEF60
MDQSKLLQKIEELSMKRFTGTASKNLRWMDIKICLSHEGLQSKCQKSQRLKQNRSL